MEEQEKDENAPLDLSRFVPITHDIFFHMIFSDPDVARAFLRKTLKPEAVELMDLENLEIHPTKLVTEEGQEFRADMIYRVPLKQEGREVHFYTILEHKAQNDHWAIFQVTQYVAEMERKVFKAAEKAEILTTDFLIPVIIPVIICHGERPFTGPKHSIEIHEKFFGYEKLCLNVEAIWHDLSCIADEDLPNDPNVPVLNMGLRLMKYIMHENFKEKFLEILICLQEYLPNPEYQYFRRLSMKYAISRARYFTEEDLQEVIKQVPNPTQEKEKMTLMEQWITKGKVEGKVEGKAEGKAELILLILSSMGHVPQELVDRILAMDASRLNDLAILLKKSDSIEEFEKAL